MTSGNETSKSMFRSISGGAASAFLSTTALQPLDVLKTRVQEASVSKSSNQFVLKKVAGEILASRGFLGFWSGLTASLWRNIPGIALYFGTLNTTMSVIHELHPGERYSPLILAGAAASSRCLSATILFPFTFVKTRFESRKFQYSSILRSFRHIASSEGFSVLFRGFIPTMARDIPFSAVYFPIYSHVKYLYSETISPEFALSSVGLFSAGCISGASASILTQPADVIKTHMQLDPARFTSIKETVKIVLTNDGFMGLFRGSLLRITRRTIITAVNWSIFERIIGEVTPSSQQS